MYDAFNITSPSPNIQHRALFALSGEVRFGPSYYVLSVDNYAFGQRIFGSPHLWSPDSNLLAVQEWLTLDYSLGPITALVLIDVQLRREITLAQTVKRFLVPDKFEGSDIVYREDYAGQEGVKYIEQDYTNLKEWKTFL